jgi:glutamyl-tRNA reductase
VKLVSFGLSHKTAPIELREKLANATKPLEVALRDLKRGTIIEEACIISTCNRVEFYVAGNAEPAALARDLRAFIQGSTGISPAELEACLYHHEGPAGLRHLFRVACSLDSMVLGEPQILGQVKEAYQAAVEAKATGPTLTRVFQKAFAIAKRVRTETGISQNAVSMSFAAVELGREIFTSLDGKNVLVVGAGKMSTLAAKHLRSNGVAEIRVANRSLERASELAQEIGGHASSLDDLELLLQRADIVISSTAAPGFVVTKALMSKVVRHRRYRAILFVDLAVPRDIEPSIGDLENCFVYDVDDLESVVEFNREARAKEARAAEGIIEDEIQSFLRWARSQQVVPVIKALREKGMSIAQSEAEKALASIKASDPRVEKSVRAMSQSIVNKILHPVLTRLKTEGAEGDPAQIVGAIEALFELRIEPEPAPDDDIPATEPLSNTGELRLSDPPAAGEPGTVVPLTRDRR